MFMEDSFVMVIVTFSTLYSFMFTLYFVKISVKSLEQNEDRLIMLCINLVLMELEILLVRTERG